MAYTDLVIQLGVTSIAEDGGQIIIADNTGFYPEEPGGYALPGEGTATRPELAGVERWIFYRKTPFSNQDYTFIPLTQGGPPWTISLLDEDGEPFADACWQFVMIVVDDTLNYLELLEEGFDFAQFIQLGQGGGAVGQLAVTVAPVGINCVNDARRRLNNAQTGGGCDCTEYALKLALLQGAVSNAAIAGGYSDPLSAKGEYRYEKSQEILDVLNNVCLDGSCRCNC